MHLNTVSRVMDVLKLTEVLATVIIVLQSSGNYVLLYRVYRFDKHAASFSDILQ